MQASAVSLGDEEEGNLEWEVFGTSNDRHYGINILDKNGEVILSDPTDRVLRAVVHPEGAPESLALHKVIPAAPSALTWNVRLGNQVNGI